LKVIYIDIYIVQTYSLFLHQIILGIERKDIKTIQLGVPRYIFLTTYYLRKSEKTIKLERTLERIENIKIIDTPKEKLKCETY
jgi:hypothetical protein